MVARGLPARWDEARRVRWRTTETRNGRNAWGDLGAGVRHQSAASADLDVAPRVACGAASKWGSSSLESKIRISRLAVATDSAASARSSQPRLGVLLSLSELRRPRTRTSTAFIDMNTACPHLPKEKRLSWPSLLGLPAGSSVIVACTQAHRPRCPSQLAGFWVCRAARAEAASMQSGNTIWFPQVSARPWTVFRSDGGSRSATRELQCWNLRERLLASRSTDIETRRCGDE